MSFKVQDHVLVPKHTKITDKEVEELLHKYNITKYQLPKILTKDPAIQEMDVKLGDIIKIIRKSPTAGKSIFYRVVV